MYSAGKSFGNGTLLKQLWHFTNSLYPSSNKTCAVYVVNVPHRCFQLIITGMVIIILDLLSYCLNDTFITCERRLCSVQQRLRPTRWTQPFTLCHGTRFTSPNVILSLIQNYHAICNPLLFHCAVAQRLERQNLSREKSWVASCVATQLWVHSALLSSLISL